MAWQATLHCGPHQVSWGEFSTAVSLLVKRFRESDPSLQDMGEVSSLAAYRLVQHTASIGRRGEEGHHTTSIGRRREGGGGGGRGGGRARARGGRGAGAAAGGAGGPRGTGDAGRG